MSRIEVPRPWLGQMLGRHGRMPIDDPTLDRLQRVLHRDEPDPLFRHRLRGQVLNRYVAVREGMVEAPRRRREMGRLGRATLYASLGLVISVSAAAAASQQALPGDALYGVKLQLEEIRMRVAPAHLRDDLAAMALDERLDEVETLAAAGNWAGVAHAAVGVLAAERRVAAFGNALDAEDAAAIQQHVEVLERLLAAAPAAALPGLQTALDASSHIGNGSEGSQGSGTQGSAAQGGGAGDADGDVPPSAAPSAAPTTTPSTTPRQSPSADPHPTPKPKEASPKESPLPEDLPGDLSDDTPEDVPGDMPDDTLEDPPESPVAPE